MILWLRGHCGAASFAISKRYGSETRLSGLALRLPAPRTGAHHRSGHLGKLFTNSRRDVHSPIRAGRDALLGGVPKEYKDDVTRVVEQAERAAETSWTTIHTGQILTLQGSSERDLEAPHTNLDSLSLCKSVGFPCADFYTPPVVSHAMLAIQQLASVKAVPYGGYSQAERQRIIMGQPELVDALELDPSQVSCEHAAKSCTADLLASEIIMLGWTLLEALTRLKGSAAGCMAALSLCIMLKEASDMQDNSVAALNVKGNFMFESATHRLVSAAHP